MSLVSAPTAALLTRRDEIRRLDVLGSTIGFLITCEQSDGAVSQFEVTAPPGVFVPTHTHLDEDEFFFVLQGSIRFTVGDKTVVANPGDAIFAPKNIPHTWAAVGDTTALAVVTITPGKLEHMFHEIDGAKPDPAGVKQTIDTCARYNVFFA